MWLWERRKDGPERGNTSTGESMKVRKSKACVGEKFKATGDFVESIRRWAKWC